MNISGPVIQTHSGLYFNLLNPDPKDVRIEDIAHALSNLCRFGGHTRQFYSVAQHSLLVSKIIPHRMALHALLHDAAEAYCGDVVSPLKMCIPGFSTIEKRIQEDSVLNGLPELCAAVDAFNAANAEFKSWEPNYKRALIVSLPKTETPDE